MQPWGRAEVTTDYGRGGVEGGTTTAAAGGRSIIAGLVTVTVDPRTAGLDTLDTTYCYCTNVTKGTQ